MKAPAPEAPVMDSRHFPPVSLQQHAPGPCQSITPQGAQHLSSFFFFSPVWTVNVGGGNLQVAPPTNTWWELVEKWLQLFIDSDGIILRSAEHYHLRSLTSWSLSCLVRNMVFNEPVNQNLRNGNLTEIKRCLLGVC